MFPSGLSFPSGPTLHRRAWHALSHLPDAGGGPFWADLQILRRPLPFTRDVQARCGPVARTVIGGIPHVLLLSAGALETVLLDRERVFSAGGGWSPLLGELFPRGLRREALADYLQRMVAPIDHAVQTWLHARTLPSLGLPAQRSLALTLAADLLLALRDPAHVAQAERDFSALVDASTALVRVPLLGQRYQRGLKARARLVTQLTALTRLRRQQPGPDLLSRLIEARDEDGQHLEDDEIVDHLVFFMMAAHDTTASALSSALGYLAQHPDLQAALREELEAEDPTQPLFERLAARHGLGRVIREVLRLNPPVALLQRQTLRETIVEGHRLPAGARLTLVPLHVQRDAKWWVEPDRFNPERFNPDRPNPGRSSSDPRDPSRMPPTAALPPHPYAWAPFGGGQHLCLGLHLADAQMRLALGALLQKATVSLPPGRTPRWKFAPITHPAEPTPVLIAPLNAG